MTNDAGILLLITIFGVLVIAKVVADTYYPEAKS